MRKELLRRSAESDFGSIVGRPVDYTRSAFAPSTRAEVIAWAPLRKEYVVQPAGTDRLELLDVLHSEVRCKHAASTLQAPELVVPGFGRIVTALGVVPVAACMLRHHMQHVCTGSVRSS